MLRVQAVLIAAAAVAWVLSSAAVIAILVPLSHADAASPAVWIEDGNVQVLQSSPVQSKNSVTLSAAKGEWTDFQVVVNGASGGLSNVNVSVSDLTSSSGGTIPGSVMTLYREQYVPVPLIDGISAGNYPAWLIPFNDPATGADLHGTLDAAPFSVASGQNQVVWVDLQVPSGTPEGTYTGTATVTSSQGSASVNVTLNVWNFSLPFPLTFKGEGSLWNGTSKESVIQLLKHNVGIRELPDLSWQDEMVTQYGLRTQNAGFWTGNSISNCLNGTAKMPSPPSAAAVANKRAKYRSDLLVYGYFADEVGRCLSLSGFSDWIKSYAKALQDGGVTPLLTISPDDRAWIPGPYIWAMSIDAFDGRFQSRVDKALQAGQQMWSYHFITQYSAKVPKFFGISEPPIHMRIQAGFMSQAIHATGLMFFTMDHWDGKSTSWTTLDNYYGGYGDGQVVADGSVVGVPFDVPGLGLKRFRDGSEDFEYVELLKKAGQESWAMEKVKSIVASATDWTKDMDALLAVRKELGDTLSSLNLPTLTHRGQSKGSPSVLVQSSPAGVRIRASKISAVQIFDLRGNRLPLDRMSRSADGNDVIVTGLPHGAFIVRVKAEDRLETVGLARF